MSKPCPCYGPCLAGDDRCPLIAPDPVAALLRHERDSLATQLEQMRRERDEARALAFAMRDLDECASLLDCEVTEVIDGVRSALARVQDAEYASKSLREYVDANAASVQETWGILGRTAPLVECAKRTVAERDDARAKLARISRAISHRYMLGETADETCRTVLRIIDEKEGGQ